MTSSANLLPAKNVDLSDHVVILENRIIEQGTWEELRNKTQPITEHNDETTPDTVDGEDTTPAAIKRDKTPISPTSPSDDLKRSQGDLSLYRTFPLSFNKIDEANNVIQGTTSLMLGLLTFC